ncbi:putative Zn-dependent peptidase [Deinobacterium chartae]|uniref:Putative Zn-dependent peptidase n=1 Tax=Deinobacterium chartae TaxID=521158 RepID=A0A841I2V9_9DEIO|nr:pitrilysin family protein [Deinobacterium chartae]MBB6098750.1 putative Zn-dependent peptidase [Deinobacterium chartae]
MLKQETVFHRETLDNGLTVIGEVLPEARSVAVGYFVRTGARDERVTEPGAPDNESGLSHFLEHMLFKGNDTLSAFDINRRFDELGANYNAFTSEEVTVYHGAVLAHSAFELLELFSQMMRPALREEDFRIEQQVILEEIEMYRDNPQARLFDEARPAYYGTHPLGHSVLGSSASVRGLTPQVMRDYWHRRYAPDNLTLAVSGRFDWNELLRWARTLTQDWVPAGQAGRAYPEFRPQPRRHLLEDDSLNRASVALMMPGLPASSALRDAANVLAEAIGGENGRLYWALMDEGLADAAQLGHVDEDGLGHFEGFLSSDPERAQENLEVFLQVLREVQDQGLTESEVARARRKLAVGSALRAETPYNRLFSLGIEWLYTGRYVSPQEAVARVNAVTVQDVQRILEGRPFDTVSITALGPAGTLTF